MLGEKIVEAIHLAKTKYNTSVCGIINDNASNMKLGASIASDILIKEGVSAIGLLESTCYSHSGNLLIKDIVEQDLLDQLSKVVKAYSTPNMHQKIHSKGGCPLKNYPETRFCFVVYTCESIYKNLEYLKVLAADEDISDYVSDLINSVEFERKLWGTINLLTPICKLINHCQDPKVNVADGTELWLALTLRNNEFDVEIQERIYRAISDVGYAAHLMHHKYKGKRLDEDQTTLAKNYLKNKLDAVGKTELDRFLDIRNQMNDELAEHCVDPISYWAMKSLEYPVLSDLCKKIMLIPASTAVLEGLFSMWTYVHNKYRNKLSNISSGLLIDIYHDEVA